MMQCTSCGYRIDADARECPLCGERMKRVSGRKAMKTPEPSAHAEENHAHCATEPWPQEEKKKPDYRRRSAEAFRQEADDSVKPMVVKGGWMIAAVILSVTAVIAALSSIFNIGNLFSAMSRLILANLCVGLSRVPCQPAVPNRPVEKKKLVTGSVIAAVALGILSSVVSGILGGYYTGSGVMGAIVLLVVVGIALGKRKNR